MAQPPILYGTAAGGSLAGSYPNPTLADGAVLRNHIGVAAVGANEVEDHSLTADKLASGIGLGTVITVPENIDSGVITPAHLALLTTYVRTQGNQLISGNKSFERLMLWHWPTQPYDVTNKWYVDSMIMSGGGANPNLESYASGTRTLNIINQSNITLVTNYASGIEALRRAMVGGASPSLEAYASGTRNTQITIQNGLTSTNNTVSGINTTVHNIEVYVSGIGARPSGGTSTATGSSIRQTYTQTNSFINLDAVYMRTDNIWDKAKADNVVTAESVGIVESTSGNQFTVVFEGEIANQSGLIPGFVYFLSPTTAGSLTTTEPSTSGTISKPVMVAISTDKGIVTSYRGIMNGVSGSSSTGGDTTAVEQYASGIETMRRAMTGSNPGLESYASGTNLLAQAQTPRDVDFWLRSRDRVDVTGGAGLSFNANDFSQETSSNPGLLTGYDITLNTKYSSSISGVNANLADTQNRVTVIETSGGGTPNATKKTISHDKLLQTLNAVYCDSNKVWQKSVANSSDNAEVVGIVESTSGNSSTIVLQGQISNSSILAGTVYYLSDVTAGALQTSEATNLSKPVMIGIDSGVGVVQILRGLISSGSTSIPLPLNYLAGFGTAPYATGTSNISGISIAAGSARDTSNNYNIIDATGIVKTITGPWQAGSLQNGIDSGNRAANTWYHAYEITNGSTVDAILSTNATAPSLPTGYVASRRVASVKTDSTGYIIPYYQLGDRFLWSSPTTDANGAAINTSAVLVTISIPSGVKVIPLLNWFNLAKAAAIPISYVSSPDVTDGAVTAPYVSNAPMASGQSSPSFGFGYSFWSNTSSQIRVRCDTASSSYTIITAGWIDPRGKDS